MEPSLNLTELLGTALAGGAVGFTLRSGLHPIIYSAKGVQTYDTQKSTADEIEEALRQIVSSREMRQFRETGVVHFRCVLDGIPLVGGTRTDGGEVYVDLRKPPAYAVLNEL
jgi:Tfp pilus assembly pilus retraction ATPase PilT